MDTDAMDAGGISPESGDSNGSHDTLVSESTSTSGGSTQPGLSPDASSDSASCVGCDAGTMGSTLVTEGSSAASTSDLEVNTSWPSSSVVPSSSEGVGADTQDTTQMGTSSESSSQVSSSSEPPPERWAEADAFFSQSEIVQIDIQLPAESVSSLRSDSETYVHGALQVTLNDGGSVNLADLGVRLKGRLGSARTLDEKAAFLLKTNEFVKGQRLFGLTKLALNNMVQDPSMIREQLSYQLFRAMGVPAPRTGFARVTLNGELMGLYATVEAVDNASFMEHWFGDEDGQLYEGEYGADLEVGLVTSFDKDRGDDVGFEDLLELASALDQLGDPADFVSEIAEWIDIEQYARFAATELFMSHWDGYAATRNNYFVYRPRGGRWAWIPWGTDQTFGDVDYPLWRGGGRVQQLCYQSLECRQKLAAAYGDLIGLVAQLGLPRQVTELETLITPAATEDPRKEDDMDTFHAAIEEMRVYLQGRPSFVVDELICTDPANVDLDNDGASGCGDDCNDSDPTVFPGAVESCNVIDDNCDGEIDNAAECPRCPVREDEAGNKFALCFDPTDYESARADCVSQGGHLASIHSAEQQAWVSNAAWLLKLGSDWWIGLNDLVEEGTFAWDDGTEVDFTFWGPDEPNDWRDSEDCVGFSWAWEWNDVSCSNLARYICALP